jgi:hypothetical protein
MKIKLFSHAVCLNGDVSITKEQTNLLMESGLFFGAHSEINMMLHYNKEDFDWLIKTWPEVPGSVNYKVFDESYKEWHEGTTIYHIQELVHSTEEEFYVCYIHHKGVSSGQHSWRHYMQYWNIEKWKECVAKLDEGYDLCGASFLNNPPHPFYAGNFFWARASYLRKCKRIKSPAENNFQPQFSGQPHHRFDYECWHGSGNPKAYDMHPGPDNRWYWPPQLYRN